MRWIVYSFEPGDILVFDGRGLVSRAIRAATCSPHSHVAFCAEVRRQDLTVANGLGDWGLTLKERDRWMDTILAFESTTLNEAPCVLQKKRVSGTQAHFPAAMIRSYNGRVWRLRLRNKLIEKESEELTKHFLRSIPTEYDFGGALLSGSLWLKHGWRAARAADRSTLFCCEYGIAALELSLDSCRHYDRVNTGTLSPGELVEWARQLYHKKELLKDFGPCVCVS